MPIFHCFFILFLFSLNKYNIVTLKKIKVNAFILVSQPCSVL
nr:MAG TPA: hypothetical protein [Caudoviricetes sp.]